MNKILKLCVAGMLFSSAMVHADVSGTGQEQSVVSQAGLQGMKAMKDVQYARLALFRGEPDVAGNLVNEAKKILAGEQDWASARPLSGKKAPQTGDFYVVIDSGLTLAEDFTVSPEKQEAINKANQKLSKGDKKGAIEDLHLAGVDVSETQVLMPLKQTLQKIDSAQTLLNESKYYEANLALKGAEDGVVIDTETLTGD
ncbi:YfdX family protein [Escherichia coli]|uniref:YfdX family protein n=1 Tax=Escherichia coli TaxID=562 RepID=UPI0038B2BFC7